MAAFMMGVFLSGLFLCGISSALQFYSHCLKDFVLDAIVNVHPRNRHYVWFAFTMARNRDVVWFFLWVGLKLIHVIFLNPEDAVHWVFEHTTIVQLKNAEHVPFLVGLGIFVYEGHVA